MTHPRLFVVLALACCLFRCGTESTPGMDAEKDGIDGTGKQDADMGKEIPPEAGEDIIPDAEPDVPLTDVPADTNKEDANNEDTNEEDTEEDSNKGEPGLEDMNQIDVNPKDMNGDEEDTKSGDTGDATLETDAACIHPVINLSCWGADCQTNGDCGCDPLMTCFDFNGARACDIGCASDCDCPATSPFGPLVCHEAPPPPEGGSNHVCGSSY
jgi:hypothetical protein